MCSVRRGCETGWVEDQDPQDLSEVVARLRQFAAERDWDQFHSPRNLLLALTGEVGELASLVQWRTDAEVEQMLADQDGRRQLEEEVADVAIYLLRLADVCGIDLLSAVTDKIAVNARKYPVEKSKGSARKYTEF